MGFFCGNNFFPLDNSSSLFRELGVPGIRMRFRWSLHVAEEDIVVIQGRSKIEEDWSREFSVDTFVFCFMV